MAMVPSILDGSRDVFGAPGLVRCGRQVQCVEERWQGMWLSGVSHKHGVQGREEWDWEGENGEVERAGKEEKER